MAHHDATVLFREVSDFQNRGACRPPKFRPDEGFTLFLCFPFLRAFIACLCNPEDLCPCTIVQPFLHIQSSTAFTVRTYQIHHMTLPDFAKQSRHPYQKTQRRFSPAGQILHGALMPLSLPEVPKI